MTFYFTTPHQLRRQMFRSCYPSVAQSMVFPIDVIAEADAYIITAAIPGVSAEDLSIEVTNDLVTIKGEIKVQEDDRTYLLQERPTGTFERTIRLPDDLDSTQTEADLKNGILTLRIGKVEEAKPRTIKVKTAE